MRLVQGQMGCVMADHAAAYADLKAITDPDPAAAKRAFDAIMQMRKIDLAAIEAARRGLGIWAKTRGGMAIKL